MLSSISSIARRNPGFPLCLKISHRPTLCRPLPFYTKELHRCLSSSSTSDTSPAWVRNLNDSIERCPTETLAAYVFCDISAIGFWFGAVTLLGIEGSADLALALGISRIMRRVRLPVDLLGAAALATVYPPLTQVNITKLFTQGLADMSATPTRVEPSGMFSALRRHSVGGFRVVGRLVDRYGLALTVAQVKRGVSLCTVFYFAMHCCCNPPCTPENVRWRFQCHVDLCPDKIRRGRPG